MKPFYETIPRRIRRFYVKPKDRDRERSPSDVFPFGVVFSVLGVVKVGVIVGLACGGFFRHYTDVLINLSHR